jgi:pimeloyl-ACP methyl ester carboxylesterase
MPPAPPKLILLPGLDGTGELFTGFTKCLPNDLETVVIRYPSDKTLSYSELQQLVQSLTPHSKPYVLLAESFSTPLAIGCAAAAGPNLKGLILCAGFAKNPVRPWLRWIVPFSRTIFAFPLLERAAKWFLVGTNAPLSLLAAVRSAIASVQPGVLSDRVRSVAICDMRAELQRIAIPILFIQAGKDRLVGPASLDEIRRLKPDATFTVIASPHLVLQREPLQAAEIVAKFVSQLEPEQR